MVRPLVGTGVTPNHLTGLRLVTGIAACGLVATGNPAWRLAAASLWLVSAFLDRADGELARIGDMMSEQGHRYDYLCDLAVNTLFFAAAGLGERHGWLGPWSIPIGVLTTAAMLVCWVGGEAFQRRQTSRQKPYAGRWGFDLDDGLYLLAPLIGFGLLSFVLAGAVVATSAMAVAIIVRLRRLRAA